MRIEDKKFKDLQFNKSGSVIFAALIENESEEQIEKFGVQERTLSKWMTILGEEFGSLCKAVNELDAIPICDDILEKIRFQFCCGEIKKEAVQVMTLAAKIYEMIEIFNKEE